MTTLEPEVAEYIQRLDDTLPPNPIPDWVQHYADLNAHLVKRREDLDRAEAEVAALDLWWREG
jgi:hypothetical protein